MSNRRAIAPCAKVIMVLYKLPLSSAPEPSESYYTQPERVPVNATADLKEFWMGAKRLPPPPPPPQPAIVPAILIKKAGDFPPFWQKDISFLEVMSDFYTRVKTKNKEVL